MTKAKEALECIAFETDIFVERVNGFHHEKTTIPDDVKETIRKALELLDKVESGISIKIKKDYVTSTEMEHIADNSYRRGQVNGRNALIDEINEKYILIERE